MISMELSSVQHNAAKSAELSAAVERYLAGGGTVSTLKGFAHKPKPEARAYGRKHAPQISKAPVAAMPKRRTGASGIRVAEDIKERVRHLAKTMPRIRVSEETGLSGYVLSRIAHEGGFEFLKWNPNDVMVTRQTDPIADALNVVRIKDARDRGLSQKEALLALGISNTLMKRLIRDFAIDYPLHQVRR
jgi:hypothetical protein